MEITSLQDAIEDLRPSEFVMWMEFHEIKMPYNTTMTSLAKKLSAGRSRAVVTNVLEGLRAKKYVDVKETPTKKKKIILKRRLRVSAGAYARF